MGVKIIFLDIDGVLNTEFTPDRCDGFLGIEDRYVKNLKKIVDSDKDIRIVLSSTWRLGYTTYGYKLEHHREYLEIKLSKQGLCIYDATPEMSRTGESRGQEIYQWLKDHERLRVEQWVVLDDMYFYDFNVYNIMHHWISTNPFSADGGLNDLKVEQAIRVLNGENAYDVERNSESI